MPIETEIKFRVEDLAGLTKQLEAAGFRLQTPRAFESNVLYDTPDRQMRARTEILRIRNYAGRCTVTHKSVPDAGVPSDTGSPASDLGSKGWGGRSSSLGWDDGPGEDRHKHRMEIESEVADGAALEEIFLSIGLVAAFRYEKWRAEWTDGEGHCVVDETPIGNFAELEGSPEWIDRAAARLCIDPAQYIILSYGRLFDLWRDEHHSTGEDMTFAAIKAAVS
ncbi:MAG: class IV adenylate cyclase [Terracidiphilus sp.]